MRRTRIKICGVMRPEDAAAACAAGADAIGMIFHPPSPRNIFVERAMLIMEQVAPFVTPVGVFVDSPPPKITEIAATVGLRVVQLNGNETPDDVRAMRGLHIIKAIRVVRGQLQAALQPWHDVKNLIGLVMEPGGTTEPGGTGARNDWDEVIDAHRAGAFNNLPPLIAAGGLKPENVADVVRRVRPFAVDVSSGVERERGIKSRELIDEFVRTVRAADEKSSADSSAA
ncbi:MAG: phosphoribosylanthranilate isomerase [Humisphaera sp.]|nr:phosphoribosylanthranilate isomerase [Humisphaera sp.]